MSNALDSLAGPKTEIPDILAPGATSLPFTTPLQTASPTSFTTTSVPPTTRPSTTASATPSSTPTSAHHAGLSPGLKAAAIAIPIVFVALLIPLIYLLLRSHQIRKANEEEAARRSSRQPMMPKPMSEVPPAVPEKTGIRTTAPPPARPSRPRSKLGSRKSVNSLGLFDFEFNSSPSPFIMTPKSPRLSRHLSFLHKRDKEPETFKEMSPTLSNSSTALGDSHDGKDPQSPVKPQFAPLNKIGLAQSRDQRKPSVSPQRPSNDGGSPIQDPGLPVKAPGLAEVQSSPYQNPNQAWQQTHQSGHTQNENNERGIDRQLSGISRRETSSALSMTNRYSDVSALTSDEGDHRRSSNFFGNSGPAQPHRIL